MPELPEVETIARALQERLSQRTIVDCFYATSRVFRGTFPDASLEGALIRDVRRHGKHILVETDRGILSLHLGMTGKLLFDVPHNAYTRAAWQLLHGGQQQQLVFEDVRQFGRVTFSSQLPPHIASLGPDPLEIEEADFVTALRLRRTRVKALLLNQQFLRGVGNIYADEALFRAGIHPMAIAARVSKPRAAALWAAVQQVLREAIAAGGSSISDYVDADGNTGSFQDRHNVYGREGKPCPHCALPIEKIFLAQRGTHFCPHCQRR